MVISKMVGARVRRKEDPRLITGTSTYVDDVQLPGILHAAFVRSEYAHGILNSVDVTEAEAAPGVVAIITGENIGDYLKSIDSEGAGEDTGEEEEDEGSIHVPPIRPLATGKVRYVGEGIAMVIAETPAQAVDAAELVVVDIDPLEAVTDVFAAMEDGSTLVYDDVANNIGAVVGGKRGGDVDAAFAAAPFTISARIQCQRLSAVQAMCPG